MALEDRASIEARTQAILDMPREFETIEFKQAEPFDLLKFKIAKTAMAMANLRDGGLIIIGVRQDERKAFVAEGVPHDVAETYVQEPVYEFVSKYASPPVEMIVVPVRHNDKTYVTICISPFERTPVICRNNSPDSTPGGDKLVIGAVYVRTGSPVSTERVKSAQMMSDLLELAVIRRIAEQERIRRAAGIGDGPPAAIPKWFDVEIDDVADYL